MAGSMPRNAPRFRHRNPEQQQRASRCCCPKLCKLPGSPYGGPRTAGRRPGGHRGRRPDSQVATLGRRRRGKRSAAQFRGQRRADRPRRSPSYGSAGQAAITCSCRRERSRWGCEVHLASSRCSRRSVGGTSVTVEVPLQMQFDSAPPGGARRSVSIPCWPPGPITSSPNDPLTVARQRAELRRGALSEPLQRRGPHVARELEQPPV